MKELIIENSNRTALVDDDTYEELDGFRWYLNCRGYASGFRDGKPTLLHRYVLKDCPIGMNRDHINGNKLDNQRSNLRIVTAQQNASNRGVVRKLAAIRSVFKGVYWSRGSKKWSASIKVNQHRHHLGTFSDERIAAKAYNAAAIQFFGEYARLNEVDKV